MIVRILGEGQYDVSDARVADLNELDGRLEAAVEGGDEDGFRTALEALLQGVRGGGSPLADDSLVDSDLILPPADATLDEVRALLSDNEAGDGLIPG